MYLSLNSNFFAISNSRVITYRYTFFILWFTQHVNNQVGRLEHTQDNINYSFHVIAIVYFDGHIKNVNLI